uniref:metallophosphoesterase n=1 Tax=Gorillibacterium massiliense TaxID=1280390 RepID=UPI000592BD7C
MLSIVKGPYLQIPTETSMTMMWETSELASAKVEVYQAERKHGGSGGNYLPPEKVITTASNGEYSLIHQITVQQLEPGTTYFYTVFSENETGALQDGPHPFKTAPGKDVPFSFTVTSETGGFHFADKTDGQINRDIFMLMGKYRPDLSLFAGDIVDDGREYADWSTYFFEPGRAFLKTTPFYSCLGNHEENADWFYKFFAYPNPKNYYSFDYGDAHFTCLDSTAFVGNEQYPGLSHELTPGNAQIDFLIRDLQASAAKWKIVFFHYSPYVSGG